LHAQDGKALFQANCASCHAVNKKLTGPALAGVEDRWPDSKMLHAWIRNNQAVIKSGYPYAVTLYDQYKVSMNTFPNFTDKDIDAILGYIKSVPPDNGGGGGGGVVIDTAADAQAARDKDLIFGIITIILAIVAFTLLQVNANLRKLASDKDGVPALEPIPFWRNKTYIMMGTLVLFTIGGYYTVQGAIGLGRSQNYEPEQPIYYSHEVHAGVNQINCQYCHTGVYQGKQATMNIVAKQNLPVPMAKK
jgi:Cytochrome c